MRELETNWLNGDRKSRVSLLFRLHKRHIHLTLSVRFHFAIDCMNERVLLIIGNDNDEYDKSIKRTIEQNNKNTFDESVKTKLQQQIE